MADDDPSGIAVDVAAMGEVGELVTGLNRHFDDGFLCSWNAAAPNLHPLSSLRLLPEVADPLPAGLRRGPVYGSRSLRSGGVAYGLAQLHAEF
jgi:hypothetical protein